MRSNQAQTECLVVSLLASILFATFFVSCQPKWIGKPAQGAWILQDHVSVCIEVSPDQLPKVVDAVKAWDRSLERWKKLHPRIGIDDSCDYTIKEVMPSPFDVGPNVLGAVPYLGSRDIFLYRGRYEVDALSVALHEMGHALGARHMEGTLMAPQLEPKLYVCPDSPTVAQVAVANEVDPTLLSWCSFP